MSKLKNSLFVKLILLLMAVIILPAIVSNVIAYRQNYNMMQKQIIDWNENMMEIGMEETIAYIRGIEQAPMNLFANAEIMRIFNKMTLFTDTDRYVIRNYGSQVAGREDGIFQIVMDCKNGESIVGVYVEDTAKRTRIGQYSYPERSEEALQVGKNTEGRPEFLIYNIDIQNVPSYDTVVSMRIFADLQLLDNMTKTLCGQYNDSVVMIYIGKEGETLLYSSDSFEAASYDRNELLQNSYVKGTLDGQRGIFFLEKAIYKGMEVNLVKFVDNHWFADPAAKVVIGAAAVQTCLLIVSVLFLFLVFNMIISPVRRMLDDMKAMEQKPEFVYKAGTRRKDELGELENQYAGMIKSLDELVNKNYRSQLEATKSRFKMLQAQINPHFLYNMLQYIGTTALKNNCQEVALQLTQLGELFQYTMNTGDDTVTLRQELHHLENYIALQEGRFNGRMHFVIRCPGKLYGIRIPKMILQPLIENSMKHGIDKKDGSGNIMVSILEKEGTCRIRVIDSGVGMSEEKIQELTEAYKGYEFNAEAGHGIGFLNVLHRCKIYYGDGFAWEIRSTPETGTTVELIIKEPEEKMQL